MPVGVIHITSQRTKQARNNSLRKEFSMALYGIVAAIVVIIVAIPGEGFLIGLNINTFIVSYHCFRYHYFCSVVSLPT